MSHYSNEAAGVIALDTSIEYEDSLSETFLEVMLKLDTDPNTSIHSLNSTIRFEEFDGVSSAGVVKDLEILPRGDLLQFNGHRIIESQLHSQNTTAQAHTDRVGMQEKPGSASSALILDYTTINEVEADGDLLDKTITVSDDESELDLDNTLVPGVTSVVCDVELASQGDNEHGESDADETDDIVVVSFPFLPAGSSQTTHRRPLTGSPLPSSCQKTMATPGRFYLYRHGFIDPDERNKTFTIYEDPKKEVDADTDNANRQKEVPYRDFNWYSSVEYARTVPKKHFSKMRSLKRMLKKRYGPDLPADLSVSVNTSASSDQSSITDLNNFD